MLEKKGLQDKKITCNFRDVSKTFILSECCEVSNSTLNHLVLEKPIFFSSFQWFQVIEKKYC